MKKLLIITVLALSALSVQTAMAQIVNVKVNGLVCSFCAVAIEKTMGKKGVKGVEVNLADKYVTFTQPEDAPLTDEEITQTITDAGYTVVDIEKVE